MAEREQVKGVSPSKFMRELRPEFYSDTSDRVTNGAIVIHTQRLKSDPGGNLLS
ncbi:TPA: hypothetical protein LZR30_004553 [Escherichia coli]|nr:hypothetical protein [Escherichia coli]